MRISIVATKYQVENVVQKIFDGFEERINQRLESLEDKGHQCQDVEIRANGGLALAVITYDQKQ